jgi:hypothetical protein
MFLTVIVHYLAHREVNVLQTNPLLGSCALDLGLSQVYKTVASRVAASSLRPWLPGIHATPEMNALITGYLLAKQLYSPFTSAYAWL